MARTNVMKSGFVKPKAKG